MATSYRNWKNYKRIILSNDCLIQQYDLLTEFDGSMSITYSYDYVQDHFKEELQNPIEANKNRIYNYDEINI